MLSMPSKKCLPENQMKLEYPLLIGPQMTRPQHFLSLEKWEHLYLEKKKVSVSIIRLSLP